MLAEKNLSYETEEKNQNIQISFAPFGSPLSQCGWVVELGGRGGEESHLSFKPLRLS